ncbi:hypothetical protein LCY76_14605 [Fictibacillus sp. KIGAM418]|uniref:PepSY domain-containing protein n=1 Tax=Fictibacillus marinisediminis TaxID=2878389 RepID=A0A9X1XBF2_9BACL|nr:hypothetical protein [Fictibacillus marinisediminis]MCK6257812.1 hypothetical protein [Fictibacillus marinisediminis]
MYRLMKTIHRLFGIIGSLLVLLMAITGLLLNHRSWIGYGSTNELKLQKWIFGIHSGVLDHTSIVWLTDLGAVCMIVFSLTGIWLWFKGSRMAKRK